MFLRGFFIFTALLLVAPRVFAINYFAPIEDSGKGIPAPADIKKNECVKALGFKDYLVLSRNEMHRVFKEVIFNNARNPKVLKQWLESERNADAVRFIFPKVNGARYEVRITPVKRSEKTVQNENGKMVKEEEWVYQVENWYNNAPIYNLDAVGQRRLMTLVFNFDVFFGEEKQAIQEKFGIKKLDKVLKLQSGVDSQENLQWNLFHSLGYIFNTLTPQFWYLRYPSAHETPEALTRLKHDREDFFKLLKKLEGHGLHLTIENGNAYIDRGFTDVFRQKLLEGFETGGDVQSLEGLESAFRWRQLLKELTIFIHNLEKSSPAKD